MRTIDVVFGVWALAGGCVAPEVGVDGGGPPTYHRDVAPILAARCSACHAAGGFGPFSVLDYADAKAWAEPMALAVEEDRMPPYFAEQDADCAMRSPLADDPRLTDDEKATLRDWVDAGAPEGDPTTGVPAIPAAIAHLEAPDAVLALSEPYVVEGTDDIYQCFRIPMPTTEDVWVTAIEVLPDNPLVVHHVIVWNDPEDQSAALAGPDGSYRCSGEPEVWPTEIVGTWTPGSGPRRSPEGIGTLVHPGASLVLNVHYHPTGTTDEVDQTQIALNWTTTPPAHHATWFLVDLPFGAQVQAGGHDGGGAPQFRIPAGAAHHEETLTLEIPPYLGVDLPVFAINPHMHYLGRDMLVNVRRESGDDECLIHTPNYRFDFQTEYAYDASEVPLPTVHIGDTIEVRCTYDNSESNPFLPAHLAAAGIDAPHDVYWGEETSDEMCMAIVGLVLPPNDWLALLGSLF
ncbi:MAG: hypothetical protein ABMB14_07655 [Myxococcota bacterium]